MDFVAFEQLTLRVLFETRDALTTPHLAYLAGISVARAERFLGRMVEEGTLTPRVGSAGAVEYLFPGKRDGLPRRAVKFPEIPSGAAPNGDTADQEAPVNSATAVLLSVLVPGAGHIYAGRSGAGVAWMATTLAGYACCLLPGLFLHGLCLVSAAHARHSGV